MAGLTTHVLDTASGKPAVNMELSLAKISDNKRSLIKKEVTNKDGRTSEPLLDSHSLEKGTYEISFNVAAYFNETRAITSNPPFLDVVVLRFSIANPKEHYHVPLLVSPWSYSTYRGS